MFPVILRFIKKINIKTSIIIIFAVYLLQILVGYLSQYVSLPGYQFEEFSKWVIYVLPLFRLGDFIMGCCIGAIYVQKRFTPNKHVATVLELVSFIMIFVADIIYIRRTGFWGQEWFRYTMLFSPSSICLVLSFAINKGLISRVLTCKPLLYIGNISSYTFLIHLMVIRYLDIILKNLFEIKLSPWITVIVALVVTVVVAEAYKKLELLFLRKKEK